MLQFRRSLLVLIVLSSPVSAQDNWRFSGFASLGAGRIEDSSVSFMDYTADEWSYESDSAIGLQLSGDLNDRLSLTLQSISRGFNWDDTSEFEPELDWFFLRYQISAEWRTRIGRMRTPHYMYSETVDVGYSYVWVRPPTDVYAPILAAFSNFDGVDLVYITDWKDINIDLQLLGGYMHRSRKELEIKVQPMIGGNLSLQKGEVLVRYGLIYDRTDIHVSAYDSAQAIYESAAVYSPIFADIANQHYAHDAWYRYQSLGLRWEHRDLTTIAEAFDIKNTDSGYANDANGWYISTQYRLGDFTPYLVAGKFKNRFNRDALSLLSESYEELPPGIPGNEGFDRLRDLSIRVIEATNYEQDTWTLGLRYELLSNVALKGEWQWFEFDDGSTGQLRQLTANPPPHSSLVSFVVDIVF